MIETEEQFQEIYDKYKNLILKLAYDGIRDYHLAQDICQETFIKMYDYREHIDVERVKSWLIVVTANQVRDFFRKNFIRKEFLDKEGILLEFPERRNSIDAYLQKQGIKELQVQMLQGLRRKNLKWYDVFMLVEYLDIPRKVVAEKHNIALSTVDSYLKKSKKWMSDKYQKDFDEL